MTFYLLPTSEPPFIRVALFVRSAYHVTLCHADGEIVVFFAVPLKHQHTSEPLRTQVCHSYIAYGRKPNPSDMLRQWLHRGFIVREQQDVFSKVSSDR